MKTKHIVTIFIDNNRTEVSISQPDEFTFSAYFFYRDKGYSKKLTLEHTHHRFYSEDLIFDNIELHEIDRSNIANHINELVDRQTS